MRVLNSRSVFFRVICFLVVTNALPLACVQFASYKPAASPSQLRIMVVVGSRSDVVKLAPIVWTLGNESKTALRVCVSGQRGGVDYSLLSAFHMRADQRLDTIVAGQTMIAWTANSLLQLERSMRSWRPDIVLVHGGTTTAVSASLAAAYAGITVAHLQAGLRTYRVKAKVSEEINRQIISTVASVHFAPTELAKSNLLLEGLPESSVHTTGSTRLDAALWINRDSVAMVKAEGFFSSLGVRFHEGKYILVTVQRRENFGKISILFAALKELCSRFENVQFLFQVDTNEKQKNVWESFRIRVLPSLTHAQTVFALSNCYAVMTDSGGLLEEASMFRVPVVVFRDFPSRMEGVDAGIALLCRVDTDRIVATVATLLEDRTYSNMKSLKVWPYGNGTAAQRVCAILMNLPRRGVRHVRVPACAKFVQRQVHYTGPVIGIVLPLFNSARYVKEAVESVVKQSDANWLLVVVDDGSTDETMVIVRAIVEGDVRVQLLWNKENKGVAVSLNKGLDFLEGHCKFVTWISGDNVLKPNFLSTLREAAVEFPEASVVTASFELIDGTGVVLKKSDGSLGGLRDALFNFRGCAAFLWSPEFGVRFDLDELYSEDYGFWIRLLRESPVTVHSNVTVMGYRHHAESLSSSISDYWGPGRRVIARKAMSDRDMLSLEGLFPGLRFCCDRDACAVAALRTLLELVKNMPRRHDFSVSFGSLSHICKLFSELHALSPRVARSVQGVEACARGTMPVVHKARVFTDLNELAEKEDVLARSRLAVLGSVTLAVVVGEGDIRFCVRHGMNWNPMAFFGRVNVLAFGKTKNHFLCGGLVQSFSSGGELVRILRALNPTVVRASESMCDIVSGAVSKNVRLVCAVSTSYAFEPQTQARVAFFWPWTTDIGQTLIAGGVSRAKVWTLGPRVNSTLFKRPPFSTKVGLAVLKKLLQNQRYNVFYVGRPDLPAKITGFELLVDAVETLGNDWCLLTAQREVGVFTRKRVINDSVAEDDLPHMFSHASVVCVSARAENLRQVVLEAQACGAVVLILPHMPQSVEGVLEPKNSTVQGLMETLLISVRYETMENQRRSGLAVARKATHSVMDRREVELYRLAIIHSQRNKNASQYAVCRDFLANFTLTFRPLHRFLLLQGVHTVKTRMSSSGNLKRLPFPFGYFFSLAQILFYGSFSLVIFHYGWVGLISSFVGEYLFIAFDALTSDRLKYNIAQLRANGLSWWSFGGIMTLLYTRGHVPARYTVEAVAKSALLLVPADVTFYFAHRFLHRHAPHLHHMHHCCKLCSYSSNCFFHPLDLLLEFGAPVGVITLISLVVLKDPWVMSMSIGFAAAWYTVDHDEYLNLHHVRHHRRINSDYPAYFSLPAHDSHDGVRAIIKEVDNMHGGAHSRS